MKCLEWIIFGLFVTWTATIEGFPADEYESPGMIANGLHKGLQNGLHYGLQKEFQNGLQKLKFGLKRECRPRPGSPWCKPKRKNLNIYDDTPKPNLAEKYPSKTTKFSLRGDSDELRNTRKFSNNRIEEQELKRNRKFDRQLSMNGFDNLLI
ncbi:uncharacterized protein LOC124436967 [Xenia sp. Carnegie-2017]|uniref:uncharacterized protein LOC124436967 n=1 Tax=Xenia sp. Carnegie-2017 TaxID=2897299 RepID=UPI001F04AC65|nr:uncharacterized protein LOC124436967 [Xenia sp. Carnegie-2017]